MKSTSCGDKCAFVKAGICNSCRDCPNYQESWWKEGESGTPVLVEDCSPKRLLLHQENLMARLLGVESSVCQLRELVNKLCSVLVDISTRSQEYAESQTKQIEVKD